MNEIAILFCPENAEKILATESIRPELFEEWMKKYAPGSDRHRLLGELRYFIPDHTTFFDNRVGCTVINSSCFDDGTFVADMTRIATEFVPVTQTRAI